jgi:hypothetical protein
MSSDRAIAELAYQLWVERGRPDGSAEGDWYEAQRQLAASSGAGSTEKGIDSSLEDSFPASDPPANHSPDLPPENAAEKWAAAGLKPRSRAPTSGKKPTSSRGNGNQPPVDETDDSVATAPGDIGEG